MAAYLHSSSGPMATNDDSDDDSLGDTTSSDEEDNVGPPPMLNIEKGADFKSMKTAILSAIENPGALDQSKPQDIISVDKDKYSTFKNKFENIEKLKAEEQEEEIKALKASSDLQGLELRRLSKTKDKFNPTLEKDEPKNCSICDKMVYPVEKITLAKRIFHKNCFNCSTCHKKLNLQTCSTTHDGKIYCKLHALAIIKPGVIAAYEKGEITDAEIEAEFDEEGDYVLVSNPRVHDSSVVRSSLKSADDLDILGSLQSRKTEWTKSAQEMGKSDKKTITMDENEAKLFEQGRVKAHSTKFIEGEAGGEHEELEDEQQNDPNVVKSTKKKEKINVESGAKAIKGKWETGMIERAQGETADRTSELDEIKKNVSVKERLKEKTAVDSNDARRKSALEEEPIDTSFSHAAKESFLKGTAFQDAKQVEKLVPSEHIKFSEVGNVKERFEKGGSLLDDGKAAMEKTIVNVERCAELGGLKAAFEQAAAASKDPLEDQMEQLRKKEQIEKEFQQIKQARKQNKQKRKKSDLESKPAEESSNNLKSEPGTVERTGKVAANSAAPATKTLEQSKWAKEPKNRPEPVNRQSPGVADSDDVDDDDDGIGDDFEVKHLLNRFKGIEQQQQQHDLQQKGPKPKRQITPPPEGYVSEPRLEIVREKGIVPTVPAEELAGIKVEAKNLKTKFEQAAAHAAQKSSEGDSVAAEEKKRQLEEEFKKLKELRQAEPDEIIEPPPESLINEKDADLAIAAEHGQKSRAKWEKIERKEAKKAQKAAAASRRSVQSVKNGN